MPIKNSNTTSTEVNKRSQQLRNDPVVNGISKLKVNGIAERASEYVDPASIQSMFSPARYLCELYNVAQELHAEKSPLHIDQRRPDLKSLVLSETMMQQEVSTLDILLETLSKNAAWSDLANTALKSADDSFTLPYDDNLTIINAVLESKATSLRNIAALLADSPDMQAVRLTPALVQEQLGLNQASYELVKVELTQEALCQRLAHVTKLTVEQLNTLVSSIKGGGVNEEQILAVLSEYVRLNRQYGLSADKFTMMVGKQEGIPADQKEPRMETISSLFGLSAAQAEMLLTLCGKPEALQGIAQGHAPHVLTIISLFENIVQWMNEQKLDLAALNAMLTDKYSTTATPELFNFLSNIYHSMDKQADPNLLKQNLCRSLAAGFHLKTEVVAGLVSWLESNDNEFTAKKFNQAIIEVFSHSPTVEKLEHHPQLVAQCQKLSQFVLIAQWAGLTQQDLELLLQPKLINGSDTLLHPSLSLLCLLAEFKAWQQQVTVPVSEALRYFNLLDANIDLNKLKLDTKELEKQLEDTNKKLTSADEKLNKIKLIKTSLDDINIEIKTIESEIKVKNDLIKRLTILIEQSSSDPLLNLSNSDKDSFAKIYNKQKDEALDVLGKLTSKLKEENSHKKDKIIEIENLNILLQVTNEEIIIDIKKREDLNIKINNNNKIINEITHSEERMLVKIHGWDKQRANEMIASIFPDQYPVNFMAVNKLCKHINMANELKVANKDFLNLKSLALETKNTDSVIKETAESLLSSL